MSTDHTVNFIKVKSTINWDEYFILQAMLASYKSKDPNTKVGCVVVDKNNHQISMGYNGMIAGIDESSVPWGNDKTVPLEYQKYGYVMHSEANAISHAKSNLEGSRLYVTLFPCNECAKLIASNKFSEVVYLSDKYYKSQESIIAKKIFDLSNIKYRQISLSKNILNGLNKYFLEFLE